jgi:hypothetical protein
MKEVHLSAFNSWQKFDYNTCEATGSQRLSSNIMSPYFSDACLIPSNCQNIFQIEATGYFPKNTFKVIYSNKIHSNTFKTIFTYFQNSSNLASLYFELRPLKLH